MIDPIMKILLGAETPRKYAIPLAIDMTDFTAATKRLGAYLLAATPKARTSIWNRVREAVEQKSLFHIVPAPLTQDNHVCVKMEPGGMFKDLLDSLGG